MASRCCSVNSDVDRLAANRSFIPHWQDTLGAGTRVWLQPVAPTGALFLRGGRIKHSNVTKDKRICCVGARLYLSPGDKSPYPPGILGFSPLQAAQPVRLPSCALSHVPLMSTLASDLPKYHRLGLTIPVCPPRQTARPEKYAALTCQVTFSTGVICTDTLECPMPPTCFTPAPILPTPPSMVAVTALSDGAENVLNVHMNSLRAWCVESQHEQQVYKVFFHQCQTLTNDEFLTVSLLIALNSSTNCDRCEGTERRAVSVSSEGATVQHCYQTKISRDMSELRADGDTTGCLSSHLHPVIMWSPHHRCDRQTFLFKFRSSVTEFPGLKQRTLKETSVRHIPFPFLNSTASWQMRTFPLAALISIFSSFSNSRPFCSSKRPIYYIVERRPPPLRSFSPQFQVWFGFSFEEAVFMKGSRILARQLDCGELESWISFICLRGCEEQCSARRTNVPLQEIPNIRKWSCVRWVGGEDERTQRFFVQEVWDTLSLCLVLGTHARPSRTASSLEWWFPPQDPGDAENGFLIRPKYRNDCTCLCTFLNLVYLSFGRLSPHGSSHFYREQLESRDRARTLGLSLLVNTNAAVSCSWSSCATSSLFHQHFMGCCFSKWIS